VRLATPVLSVAVASLLVTCSPGTGAPPDDVEILVEEMNDAVRPGGRSVG